MPFEPWDNITNAGITLPIQGKLYEIPPIGYLDEIKIRDSQAAIAEAVKAKKPVDPKKVVDNETFLKMILGGALAAMRKANVPNVVIIHAATVAHTFNLAGRDAAERLWKAGFDPEALAASMKAAQELMTNPESSPDSTPSPSTESANGTPSRASTRTTTSRTGTRRSNSKASSSRSRSTSSSPKPT